MKELLIRTITGISLIILVIGSIVLGSMPFLVITVLIYGLAIRELYQVYSYGDFKSGLVMAVSAGALLPVSFLILRYKVDLKWLIIPVAGWLIGYLWSGCRFPGVLVFFWLSLPLTSFFILGWIEYGENYHRLIPLSVIILVWINDTFAYLAGSMFGRHKLTPRLSPGKTCEGFLGGMVFTLLGGWIIFLISDEFRIESWLTGALIISVVGLMGDLFESFLKRRLNVKNMGSILPGHGGILDRFDSLLFVAPVVLTVLILIKIL